jgi:hypothetical protein
MQDSALCIKDKASPDVVGDCLCAGTGQLWSGLQTSTCATQRGGLGGFGTQWFKNGAVKIYLCLGSPFNFKNQVGKVSGYSGSTYKNLSGKGSWELE